MNIPQCKRIAAVSLCAAIIVPGIASASLITSADGMTVYDTDLNITWQTNAYLSASNTFGLPVDEILGTDIYGNVSYIFAADVAPGFMTWGGAQMWIAAMNASNYLGFSDWRLPTTLQSDASCTNQNSIYGFSDGYNCTGSELGHLYYTELGNEANPTLNNISPVGLPLVNNSGPFTNFFASIYASGTPFELNTNAAWYFSTESGAQGINLQNWATLALAVRDGAITTVPVPAAAWLFGGGLLGLIGMGRRKSS